MEDFLRLAREVSAHNSTLLDYEASSSCLDSYDSSALLDDRDCGTIFPTGENLPSVTPTINRTDRFTEIEADEIKSVMDDSITLANLPHESDLVPQVSLAINDEECCALHLSESMQLHSVSPVHTLASSGQLKCDAFYPLLSAPSGGSASAVQRADSAITPHLHVKPSLFHRKSYSLINDEFNNLPNFGNSEIPMLSEIHPTLPQSNHLCSPDLIAQLKQEDTSFCLPELGSFTENNVCVSIVPPPADKKKTSSCKVVGDKVYTPMLSQEAAQQVHNLIATKMGLSCHIMEHRTNF
ncbi:hypothetical protein FHG87_004010 [Trinorchestia longiramus]|nr:hypothetical protein FHG87_004010 [Trinorchestia longiramus]